jgi:hypothetical protein
MLLLASGCAGGDDAAPAVASLDVTMSRSRVALASPVEMTYRFVVAPDAPALGARKVFVHVLDADDELLWTDDHDPPTPTNTWKPGQTVEYTRTFFVGRYPYIGAAKVVAGLYEPGTNDRLKLSNPGRGDRSYLVAEFELLPQTENTFVIFKDGWHPTEVVGEGANRTEWQWTRKEAAVAFRNPKRDVVLYVEADNPSASPDAARSMGVLIGDELLATVPLSRDGTTIQKIAIGAAQLGSSDMVEVRFVPDKTFVPSLEGGTDSRELGARVFHVFVQ